MWRRVAVVDLTLPDEIVNAPSLAEAAERLGAHLGLDGPAPQDATRRALDDPGYAKALLGLRKLPDLRDRLLAQPAAHRLADDAPSSLGLAAKAAGSVLKWGMEGLRPAEPWVIERRLAACNSCEFQAPAPDRLVYRGVEVATGKDARICTACHCLTNTKAAISTELCPEMDPDNPGLSRWGEPWVPPEEHPKGPW